MCKTPIESLGDEGGALMNGISALRDPAEPKAFM